MLSVLPYRNYSSYLFETFGCRVHKITLDAGLTCPNRDGSKGTGGCVYCDGKGSGTGAHKEYLSITSQMGRGKEYLKRRFGAEKFIAYFQSFSNTYASIDHLASLYQEALSQTDVVGLAVGTRPDCISPEILDLLAGWQSSHRVWVEYGLQSFHPRTLDLINRGHTIQDFIEAVEQTRRRNINICVHIILGLPGEGLEDVLLTAQELSKMDIQGLKIHSLYINRGTVLEQWLEQKLYQPLEQPQYADWVCRFLEYCPPHWVVQRLTGDPDRRQLVAPQWALEKQKTLSLIRSRFLERGSGQGAKWKEGK
ncbi:MAG TPA: TIGR01212 family radical SAM protein [Thermodesulfobacteriota bacterium]|nr:TIGR01212 family radical SAM protein [Thermodesulfobacteriota bacterium]